MDDISLFLGFFSVIFAVFSCEMGVKIFYMPLFKPKKGGLELGRGTSKSNHIKGLIGGYQNKLSGFYALWVRVLSSCSVHAVLTINKIE
jgi:hypothetical protein